MSDVPSKQQAIVAVDTLVRYIESANGELREGLARTPQRVIESFEEIYSGYSGSSELILDKDLANLSFSSINFGSIRVSRFGLD